MMNKPTKSMAGARKREQISSANKTVFLWTMIAAAAVSLCVVVGYFLVKEVIFNDQVYDAKSETLSTLEQNIDNVGELERNVQALIANGDLAKVKAKETDSNYKVVLDALPVTNDSTVLGSSLLQELLPQSGVAIDTLTTLSDDIAFESEEGVEGGESDASTIPFNFAVRGNYSQIENMLADLELSIRPMNISKITIQGSDSSLQAVVAGESYFSSPQSVQLGTQKVPSE